MKKYLLLILVLIPLVIAIPEIPHQFYGSVYDTNGVINSGSVSSRLCGRQFSVPIINGNYGLSEPLLVLREDCSDVNVEFYVNSGLIRTYNYVSGGYTQLNLNVPVVDNNPPVVDNPPVDNNPTDNTDTQINDNNDDGKERDTSHIRPPPDDLVFDSDDEQEDNSVEHISIKNRITGSAVYDFVKSTPGIVTVSVGGGLSILGLLYLLKFFLL